MLRLIFLLSLLAVVPTALGQNVVLIMIDDLRHPDPWMIAPHYRQFESESISFVNAHCQVATCNPSRVSIFSGLRAASSGIYENTTNAMEVLIDEHGLPWEYLPTLLRNNGYYTSSVGKVFHGSVESWIPHNAWNEVRHLNLSDNAPIAEEEFIGGLISQSIRKTNGGGDTMLKDGRICAKAMEVLQQRVAEDKPFFLAVGFHRPHTPFTAPQSFFDLYPDGSIPLPEPEPDFLAQGYWRNLFLEDMRLPTTEEEAQKARHAYAACLSYVDSQLGRLFGRMKELGIYDSTMIVVMSDHGYQLGEKNYWAWHKDFQLDPTTRSPFLFKVPGAGPARVEAAVELLDLYPTVAEWCGVNVNEPVEGRSLVPFLTEPGMASTRVACTERSGIVGRTRWSGYSLRGAGHRFTKMYHPWSHDVFIDLFSDPLETDNLLRGPNLEPEGAEWHPVIDAMRTGFPGRVLNPAQRKELQPHHANKTDRDGDGINDVWELRRGLDSTVANLADSDRDGYSDREEFHFGSHPRDSRSQLSLLVRLVEDEIRVSFEGFGRDYRLEASGAGLEWFEVAVLPAAIGPMEWSFPLQDAQFFRVAVNIPRAGG